MMLAELLLLPFFLSMQTEKKNERRQKKKLSKALWKGCNRRKKIPGHLWQWPRRLYSRVSPIQSYFARHEVRRIVEDERPELRLWLPTKLPQPRKEKKLMKLVKGDNYSMMSWILTLRLRKFCGKSQTKLGSLVYNNSLCLVTSKVTLNKLNSGVNSPIQIYFARHEVQLAEDERPELQLWLPTKLLQPRKEKNSWNS